MPSGPLPSVAICIPTYNQAGFLERAVESALGQDYQGPSEVWIADDASTDGTAELLNELQRRDPAIAVIRQAANVGIAANVSALLRAPRCELLVRLDSDDELAPGFLSRLVDLMQAYPEAGYGHSGVTEIDAAGHPTSERRLARSTGFQPAAEALRASLSGYRTVANVLIFRHEALRELDYYSGRPEFVEDYDLSVRMADVGYGNVYLDEPLARYRVWEDQGGTRSRRKGLQLKGYIRIFTEVFEPAWRRRGWDLRAVRRQRARFAAHHCAHCFGLQYTPEERAQLISLLKQLGDGPRLRLRIGLCRLGFAPWLERGTRLWGRVKAALKAAIKR
jgi:cellulose synthase/poly-beta-1,6-N-acetylglucosamine synthase-like glycosyltransferase